MLGKSWLSSQYLWVAIPTVTTATNEQMVQIQNAINGSRLVRIIVVIVEPSRNMMRRGYYLINYLMMVQYQLNSRRLMLPCIL